MTFNRKIMVRVAALAGIGLVAVSTADAQTVCRHVGQWKLVDGKYVCSGDYPSGPCVWYDDCRVNVE